MESVLRIGIIGDYDGRASHLATNDALQHCADKLGMMIEITWVPTKTLMEKVKLKLSKFHGLWCAPGSPYQNMLGAVNGIQYARENNIPFLGTCGGFQHAVLEYGKNVLKLKELQSDEFDPYTPNIFITALTCSLVGQTRKISLMRDSSMFPIYRKTEMIEQYNCSFGLERQFQDKLNDNGFQVVGTDEMGEARIMIIPSNQFFVATLFQPQLSSTWENPHPLIMEFLNKVNNIQ